jgi:hypothetical protein
VSDELVQCDAAGQVEFKLKTLRSDGITHQVMSPLEVHAAAGGAGAQVATPSANACLAALNLGSTVPGLGRDVTDALPGSPPQTSPWRWAAWKQPVVTGCTRPTADIELTNLASAEPPANLPLHALH